VTELAEHHADRGPEIHRVMIEEALQGKCVVRLKGGDPFVFGRGGEEAEALHRAGIVYEIVPGVTAAIGAAACTGIPLTHRGLASAVALVAGYEDPGKRETALDWPALAHFPGTLVVYMGFARLAQITDDMITQGKAPETPCAVVQLATTADQRTVEGPVGDIARLVEAAGMKAPTVLIMGPVVALRQQLKWFERRPLFGKRVLVTRPRPQAATMVRRLEELGAAAVCLPLIEVRPLADWRQVDERLARLKDYDWLVFTSANGVRAFMGRLRHGGRDLRALGSLMFAAIGPGTAAALESFNLNADLIPDEYRSEALAQALSKKAAGRRILLVRADRGRDVLRRELAAVANVEEIAVYSQADALEIGSVLLEQIHSGQIDYITLTSSNIARALVRQLDPTARFRIHSGEVKLVSISPVTSAAITELGLPVAAEASSYTIDGVIDALVRIAGKNARRLAEVAQRVPAQIAQESGTDNDQDVDGAIDARSKRDLQDEIEAEQEEQ
jgi:uroporphyrinogen III methyltransferase/synthase